MTAHRFLPGAEIPPGDQQSDALVIFRIQPPFHFFRTQPYRLRHHPPLPGRQRSGMQYRFTMRDEERAVIAPLQPMIFVFYPAQFDPIRQHRTQFLPRFPDGSLARTLPGLDPAAAAFQMIAQTEFILSQYMRCV